MVLLARLKDVVLRAVAYAWLLCRLGVGRERYYFGCALGASGLCFAQQVWRLGCAALLWSDNLKFTCPDGARPVVCAHTEREQCHAACVTCGQALQPSCPGDMYTV